MQVLRFSGLRAVALLCLAVVFATASVLADDLCPVCGKRLGATVYRISRIGYKEKAIICESCGKVESTCYVCRIPVVRNYIALEDGRFLCSDDAPRAVLDQETADKLFDDAKTWCQGLFSRHGVLPHRNIKLILEAKARLDDRGDDLISRHDSMLLMGLTRSHVNNEREFEHLVFILYGLTQDRFLTTAAHEYGHTWLHENVGPERKLERDTVEGFCDWLGYKYAVEHQLELEQELRLKSTYSHGQMQAFVAAEKEYDFYRIIQWIKFGVDREIDPENLRCIVNVKQSANAETLPAFAMAPVKPRPAPDKLLLKGISGTAARRFALINDQTFMANEQAKVRLGTSNVIVRCLEIRESSVVIQIVGSDQKLELQLTPK